MLEGFNEELQREAFGVWCEQNTRIGRRALVAEARRHYEDWVLVCRSLEQDPMALRLLPQDTLHCAVMAYYVLPNNIISLRIAKILRDELARRDMI